jgi:CRISPR-associated endonuclease/helicase Cas3
MADHFQTFFAAATSKPEPYDYQKRLACGEQREGEGEEEWLSHGTACASRLISIPTGLGKTAAVVLAWLWNRQRNKVASALAESPTPWPRRLVYCLPMRTLVEQTAGETQNWVDQLHKKQLITGKKPRVVILMGGEELDGEAKDWDLYPEEDAILIGTQDMLLSRALNRGYAAGRARWPKDFALLNNDCLWCFDEVQLMSTGFATSLQFQAWRDGQALRRPCLSTHSWWMSATLEKAWLYQAQDILPQIPVLWERSDKEVSRLWNDDHKTDSPTVKRLKALLQPGTKTFVPGAVAALTSDDPSKTSDYIDKVAKVLGQSMEAHPGKTLVIINTVARACQLADQPQMRAKQPLLMHSRFRHRERKDWPGKLKSSDLIIATQVIEAGVDITSKLLFTELCPWPSFIQRCGRAAREPDEKAEVRWLDVSKQPAPYSEDEMKRAKEQLALMKDVSLAGFRAHRGNLADELAAKLMPYAPRFVPQMHDLLGLFDTTPDLTGADIDVSRYIRDGDEHDVTVFWRDCSTIGKGKNPPKGRAWQPKHEELCPVPAFTKEVGFRDFARNAAGRIWRWDYRDGWSLLHRNDADRIFPGQVFLLEKTCGGYDAARGWTAKSGDQDFETGPWHGQCKQVTTVDAVEDDPGGADNTDDSDDHSRGAWRSILSHTREVCEVLEKCQRALIPDSSADADARQVLPLAARLHDWGKAHASFKAKVDPASLAAASSEVPDGLPAKAPDACWRRGKPNKEAKDTPESELDHRRPGFRHELASALAILELLRLNQPDHPALKWPDEELRARFNVAETNPASDLRDHPLALELAALSKEQFDLLLYLVAAHHGKVRFSLRSTADDLSQDVPSPCPPDQRQSRGVRDADPLPEVALPAANFADESLLAPKLSLHLDVMELGLSAQYGRSWRERVETLLAKHGPFRLAWYEAILRTADQRASRITEKTETEI